MNSYGSSIIFEGLEGARTARDSLETAQDGPKLRQDDLRWPQVGHKLAPGTLPGLIQGPAISHREIVDAQGAQGAPRALPGRSQGAPRVRNPKKM